MAKIAASGRLGQIGSVTCVTQIDRNGASKMNKTVYSFGGGVKHDDPRARDKDLLGGKGANLAEMAGEVNQSLNNQGLPI